MTIDPRRLEELLTIAAADEVSSAPLASIHSGARRRRVRRRQAAVVAGVVVLAVAALPAGLRTVAGDGSDGADTAGSTVDASALLGEGPDWNVLTAAPAAVAAATPHAGSTSDDATDDDRRSDGGRPYTTADPRAAEDSEPATTGSEVRARVDADGLHLTDGCRVVVLRHAPALSAELLAPDGHDRPRQQVRLKVVDERTLAQHTTCAAGLDQVVVDAARVTSVVVNSSRLLAYRTTSGADVLVLERSTEED